MAEQLSFTTIGGECVVARKRGKHYIQPRGYAARPGTGPAGETCGTCKHKTHAHAARSYPKCALTRACWSSTRRTDILVSAPACAKWEAR